MSKTNTITLNPLQKRANVDTKTGIVKSLTADYVAKTVESICTAIRKEMPENVKTNFPYSTDFALMVLNNRKAIYDYLNGLQKSDYQFKNELLQGFGGIVQTIQSMLKPKFFRLLQQHNETWQSKKIADFGNADFEMCFDAIVDAYNNELDAIKGKEYRTKRQSILVSQWSNFVKQEELLTKGKTEKKETKPTAQATNTQTASASA